MRAHDQQRTFRIMITAAATARSIRLIVETIIASHTGIAYHVEHDAEGTPPHQGFSLLIRVEFEVQSSGSQTGRPGAPQDFARGAAKVIAFIAGRRALGIWCRVRCVSRNFIMEKYCLEELLVSRLRSHTSQ